MCANVAVLSGTGSGIGTYILSLLKDEYPEIFRLAVCCKKYSPIYRCTRCNSNNRWMCMV